MMDPRLFQAARTGDVSALLELLQEDPFILHAVTMTSSNTPLHIASLLGHAEFAWAVMQNNSDLALELNGQGFSPMHLAAAKGYLRIVKDLLHFNPRLSFIKDREGRIPVHCAAIKGKAQVLTEMLLMCRESALERTLRGDTVLHLAVKNNQFESLVSIIQLIQQQKLDHELLNVKDIDGNTILHCATVRKQSKMVKLLVLETNVDVNAINHKGLSSLDIAVESGEKDIEEILRGAVGEQALDFSCTEEIPLQKVQLGAVRLDQHHLTTNLSDSNSRPPPRRHQQFKSLKNGLMVMASLFAQLSFDVALNPPGGLWQDWGTNDGQNRTAAAMAGIPDGAKSIPAGLIFAFPWALKHSQVPNVSEANAHRPGKAINRELAKRDFINFIIHDASCFLMSLILIVALLITEIFSFNEYVAIPILAITLSVIYHMFILFWTGLNMVTDGKVSPSSMAGAVYNFVLILGIVIVCMFIKVKKLYPRRH